MRDNELTLTVDVTGTESFKRLITLVQEIYLTTPDENARVKIAEFLGIRETTQQVLH